MKNPIFIATLCLIFSINTIAVQTKTDSLLQELKIAKADTSKIKLYLQIGDEFEYTIPDTALYFYNKALELSQETKNKNLIAKSLNYIGIVYMNQGNYAQAISYYQKSLKIREELGVKDVIANCYNNIGVVHWYQGNYAQAILYYQKSLKIFEELAESPNVALAKSGKKSMSNCYNNIGNVHFDQGNYAQAISYYQKSLKIYEELADKKGMSNCYTNIGNVHYYQGNYAQVILYYQKSLKICEELGNKEGISITLGNIAGLNNTLADSASSPDIARRKYLIAIDYAEKSLEIAKEIGALLIEKDAYKHLSTACEGLNNTDKALEYYKLYTEVKDSLFNAETHKQITEIQTKYETEKKEQKIEKQKIMLEKKGAEVKHQGAVADRQRTLRNAFIGGFILLLILAYLLYNRYLVKKRANINLADKNKIIEKQKSNIIDSINYAKRIQDSILVREEEIQKYLPETFIYFQPRDIVSGDFYWFAAHSQPSQIERPNRFQKPVRSLIVAAIDCTGHGVPGAFMSMIGNMLLNKIVNEKHITDPGEILNQLHTGVLTALQQEKKDAQSQDGMDIALCSIDIENNKLQYAGANNPLYIIRNNEKSPLKKGGVLAGGLQGDVSSKTTNLPELIEIKPDFHSIGGKLIGKEKERKFITHTININKDTAIYMFTDGYIDQFGSEKNIMFSTKRFKQLLLNNYNLNMQQQKSSLSRAMKEWKGDLKQVDDILVMGIRI